MTKCNRRILETTSDTQPDDLQIHQVCRLVSLLVVPHIQSQFAAAVDVKCVSKVWQMAKTRKSPGSPTDVWLLTDLV